MASITTRKSFRILPHGPREWTSTVVLSTPNGDFVDLRFVRDHYKTNNSLGKLAVLSFLMACDQPLAHNDWFSAGHTVSKLRDDGQGKQIMHSNFDLWIDSTTIEAENVSDEGDMHILPNGDILEAGRTIDPASGHDCEYEEIWSVEDIQVTNLTTENKPEYLCLQMNNGKHQRGRVIVLGQYCQGIQRDGNNVTVERWVWESDKREWKLERKVGSGIIPCSLAIAECESLQEGVCLNFEGFEWKILEKGQISS